MFYLFNFFFFIIFELCSVRGMTWKKTSVLASPAMTTSVLVVAAVLVAVACTSVTGVSAITSKSGPSVIKTTLQIFPPESVETTTNDRQEQPSFAARYWVSHVVLIFTHYAFFFFFLILS